MPNAIHQAEVAAQNMAGMVVEYNAAPWFWSDQYEVKLQIAGLNTGYDRIVVRPGRRDGSVSHWYFKGETLLAVDAMNDAPAFMTARRLIENAVPVASEAVSSESEGAAAARLNAYRGHIRPKAYFVPCELAI